MNSIRNLLGHLFLTMMLPVLVGLYVFAARFDIDYMAINEEIELMKLREVLLLSYDLDVKENALTFLYQEDLFTLSLTNEKLILQPGTVIYLSELDKIRFEERRGSVYLIYERQGKEYETVLCKAGSLHLGDFSDCDAELSQSVHGDERVSGERSADPERT